MKSVKKSLWKCGNKEPFFIPPKYIKAMAHKHPVVWRQKQGSVESAIVDKVNATLKIKRYIFF